MYAVYFTNTRFVFVLSGVLLAVLPLQLYPAKFVCQLLKVTLTNIAKFMKYIFFLTLTQFSGIAHYILLYKFCLTFVTVRFIEVVKPR